MDFTLQELLAQCELMKELLNKGKSIVQAEHAVLKLRILQSRLKSNLWNNAKLIAAYNETL